LETSISLLTESSPLGWKIRMRLNAQHRKTQRRNIQIHSNVGRHSGRLPDWFSFRRLLGHMSTLIPIYYSALYIGAWFFRPRFGKDVLVVSNGKADAEPWLSQITPMVKERALFLNYEEHQNWQRWSLPVMLFDTFGPSAKPASFIKYSLPALLLMRRFRLPTQYSLGNVPLISKQKWTNLRLRLGQSHLINAAGN
jgi:hypothetical protein